MKKAMMAVGMSVLLMAVSSSYAQSVKTIKNGNWVGCQSKKIKNELTGYAVSGDNTAYKNAAVIYVMRGECTVFEQGEQTYVEDTAIFSGLVKLRRKGEIVSFWTNIEAI